MATSASTSTHTNRLARETSPYLLQHQHNPVDWFPWGPEAFEKARRENKPIFLSVGYSTCYWCHVMERQCFEVESVAAVMNKHCVNIKVDREERPDVDQLYMTAVQVLTRHGGWPMSVFLTPNLEPFYGGTYFPPEDSMGRPGFPHLVEMLADAYHNRRDEVRQTTTQLVNILKQLATPRPPAESITIDSAFIENLLDRSTSDFDPANGGFGTAPKFPRETLLELILVHNRITPNKQRMDMLTRTLDALAHGGIRDQLGGGFHRYSTDARWLVPHFEIMLYDNAMLGWIYVDAWKQTKIDRFAKIARGIFDFTLREMTAPDGAFYTAFDAEVDSMEGANYLWTKEEIESLLGEDAALFNRVYGVDRGPNFADPHHGAGTPEKSILYLPKPLEQLATELELTPDALDAKLEPMRQKLYEARLKRKQPLLDTKILTSWNALMIRAMSYAGSALGEPRYTQAAEKAATFLMEHHWRDNTLYRTSRDGSPPKFEGFLDDYAFLVDALMELGWRDRAETIADAMIRQFSEPGRGGFYFTSTTATDLIVRQMIGSDSPLPSGNGIAARVMLHLNRPEIARDTVAVFAQSIEDNGESMSALVQAAALLVHSSGPFTVSSAADAAARPPDPATLAEQAVTIETRWTSPTDLDVQLNIREPFHIQAHETAPGLISTELQVPISATVEYPPGTPRRLQFADELIPLYDGQITIKVHFNEPPPSPLTLSLTYQPCDESSCLRPVTKTLDIPPNTTDPS